MHSASILLLQHSYLFWFIQLATHIWGKFSLFLSLSTLSQISFIYLSYYFISVLLFPKRFILLSLKYSHNVQDARIHHTNYCSIWNGKLIFTFKTLSSSSFWGQNLIQTIPQLFLSQFLYSTLSKENLKAKKPLSKPKNYLFVGSLSNPSQIVYMLVWHLPNLSRNLQC